MEGRCIQKRSRTTKRFTTMPTPTASNTHGKAPPHSRNGCAPYHPSNSKLLRAFSLASCCSPWPMGASRPPRCNRPYGGRHDEFRPRWHSARLRERSTNHPLWIALVAAELSLGLALLLGLLLPLLSLLFSFDLCLNLAPMRFIA